MRPLQRAKRTKVSVVDEPRSIWMQREARKLREQCHALDIPVGTQASGDSVQVIVVVARMAAKFEVALGRECLQNLSKRSGVEMPRSGDADRSISRQHMSVMYLWLTFEPLLKTPEQLNLQPPHPVAMP